MTSADATTRTINGQLLFSVTEVFFRKLLNLLQRE